MYFHNVGKKNLRVWTHSRFQPLIPHSHESFEIAYILSGEVIHYIGGEVVSLKKGDLLFLAPSTMHCIKNDDINSIVITTIVRKKTFSDYFFNVIRQNNVISNFFSRGSSLKKESNYLIFNLGNDSFARDCMLRMLYEEKYQKKHSESLQDALFATLIAYTIREYEDKCKISKTLNEPEIVANQLIQYVKDYYNSNISLETLSGVFHYSHDHISRLIKKSCGKSFSKLLADIRLENAVKLLEETSLSVSEISDNVGYLNVESFLRAFKNKYALSPSKYRIAHKSS
ncbi:MAG: AraC family transcriptional regulator [Parasporobacterium sp.]|nr:AraC family transcriptional regulator [Parasporobacterium sp.]